MIASCTLLIWHIFLHCIHCAFAMNGVTLAQVNCSVLKSVSESIAQSVCVCVDIWGPKKAQFISRLCQFPVCGWEGAKSQWKEKHDKHACRPRLCSALWHWRWGSEKALFATLKNA